jgi:hypothetical protein
MLHNTDFAKLLSTPEPPDLGPGPRQGVRSEPELNRELEQLLAQSKTKLSTDRAQLIRALVLLWHDHLDTGHTLAQSIDGSDGAFVHGIMHRREPDYGNAAYWFRRVGRHGAFPDLAERAGDLLKSDGQKSLRQQLIPGGTWDPFAFIEACERASSAEKNLLRQIQQVESQVLLDWLSK